MVPKTKSREVGSEPGSDAAVLLSAKGQRFCMETAMAAADAAPGGESTRPHEQATGDIRRDGERIIGQAKEAATSVASERKNAAADYLQAMAAAIDRGAQELSDKGRADSADLARRASRRIGDAAQRIVNREPQLLLQDLQQFARQQPALCFGIAALVGFGLMRFLRSSADRGTTDDSRARSGVSGADTTSGTWRH
jgi:hypothetical protein